MDTAIAVLLAYLTIANMAAFVAFGADKARARRRAWRIPERALLLLALLGGGIGAALGMVVFRHKVRKKRFLACFPLACALTLALGGGALYVGDYYRADEQALALAEAPSAEGGVAARAIGNHALAFEPLDPQAGFVFYPGAKVQSEAYAPLLSRCAEEGILCVLIKPALNLAIIDSKAVEGIVGQYPEIKRWAIGGHSMGGVAAAEYLSAHADEFEGIVLLASYPQVDLSGYAGWCLEVCGSIDGVLNRGRYEDAQAKLPPRTRELVIEGGNHAGFGNYGDQAGDNQADISAAEQQEQTAHAIVQALD